MSAPALGAVTAGIRYQMRFFWLRAMDMLSPRGGIEKVCFEFNEAEGVDDVAVFYAPPGRLEGGSHIGADFYQMKYHVDHRGSIDSEYFILPERTGTKSPMLRRFANTWTAQTSAKGNCRLNFVTNWRWSASDPLPECVHDTGALSERFFEGSQRSAIGKVRARWQKASGLPTADFGNFIRQCRFTFSPSMPDLRDNLIARCLAAGVKVPKMDEEALPLDDLGERLLMGSKREWDKNALLDRLRAEKLLEAEPPKAEPGASVIVRSFQAFAGLGQASHDLELDLTDLFLRRAPVDPSVWPSAVPTRLKGALAAVERLPAPLRVSLECHLSVAWLFGSLLNTKSGLRVLLRQKSSAGGFEFWDPLERKDGGMPWLFDTADAAEGEDLVVTVSATHDIRTDVGHAIRELGLKPKSLLHALLPDHGPRAVQGGAHAAALADALTSQASKVASSSRPRRVHLFMAAPVALTFLVGQRSGALGPTTVYEFDFGGSRSYSPGISTPIA